jgi:hypothetical protein
VLKFFGAFGLDYDESFNGSKLNFETWKNDLNGSSLSVLRKILM